MKLIVGLGNPGKEYINTRHNCGFRCLDYLLGDVKWKKKFKSLYYKVDENGTSIVYVKPHTYMNLSGMAINSFLKYFKIDVNDMLVIYDDMDLETGTIKLKTVGGSGGHKGIESIIEYLNTKKFNRVKIGISHSRSVEGADYVLGEFTKKELKDINEALESVGGIITDFIAYGMDKTMNSRGE